MRFTRRHFVLTGVGLLAGGCAEQRTRSVARPGPAWPDMVSRPQPRGRAVAVAPPQPRPAVVRPQPAQPQVAAGPLHVIPRSQWTRSGPKLDRINPMNGISRITVHHEGWTPVWFVDAGSTAKRLESIRNSHQGRGWADIGYHFIIDRGGRIWQGRELKYQGAHVRQNNEHNVGVMCLGNFDTQHPSDAQLTTLRNTLVTLSSQYRVPVPRIYTHQELNSTSCPGRSLQANMVALRRSGLA